MPVEAVGSFGAVAGTPAGVADLQTAGPMPDPGRVLLVPTRGSGLPSLTLILAADPATTVHDGGWDPVDRIARRPVTVYGSPGQRRIDIDAALDTRLIEQPSMTRRLEVLAAMGEPTTNRKPPPLRVLAPSLPLAEPHRWVLTALTLGSQVVQSGALVRQEVQLAFTQYIEERGVTRVAVNRTRDAQGDRRSRTIRARDGDTVRSIALRQLGDLRLWRQIREWNPALRRIDPDAPLRAGTRVVLR